MIGTYTAVVKKSENGESPINRLETAQCACSINLEIAVGGQDLEHSSLLCLLAKEVNSSRMVGVALADERNQRAGINENAPHCAAIWLSNSASAAPPRRSGRP